MIETENNPLKFWQGEFGREYMQRNQNNADTIGQAAAAFQRMFESSNVQDEIESVLEVGANVGINLLGLRKLFGGKMSLSALEPNPVAVEKLNENKELELSQVIGSSAYKIPLPDNSIDLVFTFGVLIHIPPEKLDLAMSEIVRVAKKYVLCSEYFSHTPVEVPYRGQTGMLWKRDFGKKYLEISDKLQSVDYGFIWQVEFPHYDNPNWWLFRKV